MEARSVWELLARTAEARPHHLAVHAPEGMSTYAEWVRAIEATAAGFVAQGIVPGSSVVLHLNHGAAYARCMLALWRIDAIAVPAHASLRADQLSHVIEDAKAGFLISRRAPDSLPEPLVVIDPDAEGHAAGLSPSQRSGADVATVLYTSGSTGRPKGILVSHDNLVAGSRIVCAYLGLAADDRILSVLPFNFDYGLNQLLDACRVGATLLFARSPMPGHVAETLRAGGATVLAGVPPLFAQLASARSPALRTAVPRLRRITSSGGSFPSALIERYREAWPHVDIHVMYGLSEAFRSTHLPPSELSRRPGSMGRAIPETELFVVDAQGKLLGPGEEGELVHAGPTVALGYLDRPSETARRFRPHPLRPDETAVYSGDLVRMDEEGYFYFVGRSDKMIKTSGFRVSPEEVEEIILGTGLVDEAVVHGVPDEMLGQAIEAFVVPKDDTTDEANLQRAIGRKAPAHLRPKRIRFLNDLPRTASGKVDRKAVV